MASELKPLQEFFNKRLYRIPDYQRGYAWGISQIEDFWQDLRRIPIDRFHYMGQLTLELVPKDKWQKWDEDTWLITGSNYKPYYVVDGQQRLTTAIILIKCLLEAVKDDDLLAVTPVAELTGNYLFRQAGVSKAYLFGYEKDNPSYEYLKTQILGQSSSAFQGTDTVYTANLGHARDFFKKHLAALDLTQLDDLFKRLTQRLVFNEYELDADLDVFVAFETMNNRGKSLSRLELLKNRLIYLSTLANVDEGQKTSLRRDINNSWKTIYEYLGKESDHLLDDDVFLRAHWIVSFIYARDEAEQFATFLMDEHFTPDRLTEGKLTVADIKAYVDSIQEAVKVWHSIHFPHRAGGLNDSIRQGLERLDRLGRGAFAPLMVAALLKKTSLAHIADLIEASERFVFVVGRLTQRRANTGDTEFYRLAGQLFRNETTVEAVTRTIAERTTQFFSLEKTQLEMRELFDENGFYSWSGRYYFLFEFEQSLKIKAGMQAAKIDWNEFSNAKKDHVTIEHIYPQTPRAGDWPTFESLSPECRHVLRQSLGNLLALSQSRNSTLSNRSFAIKKQDTEAAKGYFNGSYSEIAVAQSEDWTPKEILKRGLEMLDFLEGRWAISLGSRTEKLKLLNLEFLEPTPSAIAPDLGAGSATN